jgi:hypothetical protein
MSGPEQSGYLVEVRFDSGIRTAFTSPLERFAGWAGGARMKVEDVRANK